MISKRIKVPKKKKAKNHSLMKEQQKNSSNDEECSISDPDDDVPQITPNQDKNRRLSLQPKRNTNQPSKIHKTFKYINPQTKEKESESIEISRDMTISQLIQHFNNSFKSVNITGFIYNKEKYTKESNLLVMEVIADDNRKDVDIILVIENTSTSRSDGTKKNNNQKFTIVYFDDNKSVFLNPFDSASSTIKSISKGDKIVLYFPGGTIANSTFNEFLKNNTNCKSFHYYAILNQSKFSPHDDLNDEKIEINANSIISMFPDISHDYLGILYCVLKYIENQYYKSLHLIKACFEKIHFIPFVTSLYHVYNKKTTKIDLFTITSFLLFYAKNNNKLYRFFNYLSNCPCLNLSFRFNNSLKDDLYFTHDFIALKKPYDIFNDEFVDYPYSIFHASTSKELRIRRYWSLICANATFILASMDPANSNMSRIYDKINYYDPFKSTTNSSMLTMKISDLEKLENNRKNDINILRKDSKMFSNKKYSQCTITLIDYSGTMIACFDEKGTRRSLLATEIVNRFIQTASELGVNDPLIILDNQLNDADAPIEHNNDDFTEPSKLYDRIIKAIECMNKPLIKQNLDDNAYKRVLVVSDGFDVQSTAEKKDVLKLLIQEKIILDAVILKRDELINDLCAISHLSGGNYYTPYEQDDAYFIAEYQGFIDLSKRYPLLKQHFFDYFDENELEKKIEFISNRIIIKNEINSIKMKSQEDFYENIDLYSPYSYQNLAPNNLREKIIQKEINICACYQKYITSKGKEPFFRIYRRRINDESDEIDNDRIIVFLKGNDDEENRVIYQVSITFPEFYPFQMPLIKLLSNAKVEGRMENKAFMLNLPYVPGFKLINILDELNKVLISQEKYREKDNYFDPFDSFDQIDVVFRPYESKPKEFKINKKYLDIEL